MQGKRIDKQRMLRHQELGKVVDNTMTIAQAKTQLQNAKEKWEQFKSNEMACREEELLDRYDRIIKEGDTPEIEEKRQKAIKTVKEKMQRNDTFSYLTRTLGKPKNSLKKLRIHNESKSRMNTSYEREEIEKELIQFNRNHFSKAKETAAYKNKIIKALNKDEVRDKILEGILTKDDVQDNYVHDFLKLLITYK